MITRLYTGFLIVAILILNAACVPEEERQRTTGYVESLKMIHADAFFKQGLRGKDVKIGILDIGFAGINKDTALSHLVRNDQIVFIKDFLPAHKISMYRYGHGTMVIKYLAGMYPDDSLYDGSLARDASFYLVRPAAGAGAKEDARNDEFNIDTALMELHGMGVRLVNMSIGFWNEYTKEDENYSPEQMDGESTNISKICEKWAKKGMIIVNSAGNTGEYAWRIIWAPADAQGVIAVGADRFTDKVFKASYSGIGNPDVSYVKPDVITYSPYGTSFTAPIITGVIACILQKDSSLTLSQVKEILFRSASLYPYPNNFVGYGIPDAQKIVTLLENPQKDLSHVKVVHVQEEEFTIHTSSKNIVVFDKVNDYIVRRQRIREASDGLIVIKRKRNVVRTTVAIGLDQAWEIFWD